MSPPNSAPTVAVPLAAVPSVAAQPAYRRILLKVSGEVLMGDAPFGIDMITLDAVAEDIASVVSFLRSDDPLVQAAAVEDYPSQPSFFAKFLTHVAFKPFPYPGHPIPDTAGTRRPDRKRDPAARRGTGPGGDPAADAGRHRRAERTVDGQRPARRDGTGRGAGPGGTGSAGSGHTILER